MKLLFKVTSTKCLKHKRKERRAKWDGNHMQPTRPNKHPLTLGLEKSQWKRKSAKFLFGHHPLHNMWSLNSCSFPQESSGMPKSAQTSGVVVGGGLAKQGLLWGVKWWGTEWYKVWCVFRNFFQHFCLLCQYNLILPSPLLIWSFCHSQHVLLPLWLPESVGFTSCWLHQYISAGPWTNMPWNVSFVSAFSVLLLL